MSKKPITTLVRELIEAKNVSRYETLDDVALLSAVKQDPTGIIATEGRF